MVTAYLILFIIIVFLIWESRILNTQVQNIPLRILVNGTRGKSSVSEYIAAGLRQNDKATIAKITGVEPTLIFKDGKKEIIQRRSGARVQEQFQIIRKASQLKTEALCLECMSITPEYQKLESRIFKPHFYIITNIKDDHREKMGTTIDEQAQAICDAIPPNCTVVTTEVRFIDLIRNTAKKQGSEVLQVPAENQSFEKFPKHIFAENISLALKVCGLAGCHLDLALEGIRSVALEKKSPLSTISSGEKNIQFLDGFDVNDVPSAQEFLIHWQQQGFPEKGFSVLLNTRSDRPTRSVQFARWIAKTMPYVESVIISGTHIRKTEKELVRAGMAPDRIFRLHSSKAKQVPAELLNYVNENAPIVGLGNVGGLGLEFRKMLAA